MAKVLYKPVGIIVGVIAGLLAGKLFDRLWALISDEPPAGPEDRDASWTKVLVAATISGAVYGGAQALVRRGGAKGFERATGAWPGNRAPKD